MCVAARVARGGQGAEVVEVRQLHSVAPAEDSAFTVSAHEARAPRPAPAEVAEPTRCSAACRPSHARRAPYATGCRARRAGVARL